MIKRILTVALAAVSILLLVYLITLIRGPSHTNAVNQAAASAVLATRPTMGMSLAELIDRYNGFAQAGIDASAMLPQSPPEAVRNSEWHSYQVMVHPTIAITIEALNENDKPFSIGIIASPDTPIRQATMTAVMVAISASVFGQGDGAGALLRTCKRAVDAPGNTTTTMLDGRELYCSIIPGAGWMAGIAVPKQSGQ